MFTAKIIQVRALQKVFGALKEFIQEARWYCSKDGMCLQCMDPGHVLYCDFTLPSYALQYYRCDRKVVLGFNVTTIDTILKCAREDDVLTLTCDDRVDRLKFSFESPNGARRAEYEMVLLDIDEDCLSVTEPSYNVRLRLPSNKFRQICQNLSLLGNVIEIYNRGDEVHFISRGEVGNGRIVYRQPLIDSGPSKVKLVAAGTTSLQLSTRYLRFSANAFTLTSSVLLEMADNSPLAVRYDIEQFGHLIFYLAPSVNSQ